MFNGFDCPSRFQNIVGSEENQVKSLRNDSLNSPGDPVAVHESVTFSNSWTITSWLLGSSRISGETTKESFNKSRVKLKFEKLTDDVQVTHLRLHRIRVDLAHVPSLIGLLDFAYLQLPDFLLRVGDRNAMVLGDNVILNGQNRLCVDAQPSHLHQMETFPVNKSASIVITTQTLCLDGEWGKIDLWRQWAVIKAN